QVRPLSEKEVVEQCRPCLRVYPRERQLVLGKDRGFTFDYVFGERAKQREIYDECCAALVGGCLAGYNGTVMAYGQTGSGKTHTMGSGAAPRGGEEGLEMVGVIPRALQQLFGALDSSLGVEATYLEIYNEEVKDLLHPSTPARAISIREAADGEI
ncbi:P-loop containing nucleoside triphosphate hydrolase protein, partial [Pavlovales sp. CCMP2436]